MQLKLPPVPENKKTDRDKMNRDIRFFLNLQILADELIEQYQDIKFYRGQDAQTLEGVYFYNSSRALLSRYVYILKEKDLQSIFPEQHCSLIVLGEIPERWKTGVHSILQLPEETDILDLMNRCQEAFHKHESWAEKLQNIIVQEGSVDELCQISCSYFENPLFVHDSQLQVISCPVWREEMIAWEKDEQTGQLITPLEDLNDFRTNREYLHTLTTEGAHIFSAELRGYRDIYVNIRDDNGTYEGRLVICEIDNPLKPGQFASAEYLAKLIRMVLSRRGHLDIPYKRALYQMLESMVQGKSFTNSEIESRISQCKWTLTDHYVCIRTDGEEQEGNPGSAASLCNYVETKVPGSRAFFIGNQICIIINLSVNKDYTSEMAGILRDGLFKAGFSNVFDDFTRLSHYYHQASVALEYCRRRNDTKWYYMFEDIVMDYIGDLCRSQFEPEELCACELKMLREYDKENHTELYETLCKYILNERNTVATAAQLYIGRSTLFYRLRKIKEITGLAAADMAKPIKNLYLRFSMFIMKNYIEKGE